MPLFETVTGTVCNLTVTSKINLDAEASAAYKDSGIAVVAAKARSGAIFRNITANGSITTDYTNVFVSGATTGGVYTGGICGMVYNAGKDGVIHFERCTSNADITVTQGSKCFGIAGIVGASFQNSADNVGTTEFFQCVNAEAITQVSGTASVAGILGRNCEKTQNIKDNTEVIYYHDTAIIRQCANTGKLTSVSGAESIGGIVGYFRNGIISKSYSTGELAGDSGKYGIIAYSNCQYNRVVVVEYCYSTAENFINVTNRRMPSLTKGNCALTSTNLKYYTPANEPDVILTTANADDFYDNLKDKGYVQTAEGEYPVLPFQVKANNEVQYISSAAELASKITANPYGTYELTADIDNAATLDLEFGGVLDGNGCTVTVNNDALFTKVSGTVKNITVNSTINFTATADNADSAVAIVTEWALDGAIFENVTANGSITADYSAVYDTSATASTGGIYTGGICGTVLNNSVFGKVSFTRCTNNANIKVTKGSKCFGAAGIIGATFQNYDHANRMGTVYIHQCINNGNISSDLGRASIAGLVGRFSEKSCTQSNSYNETAYVTECLNTGDITVTNPEGTEAPAGLFGYFRQGVISKCYNTGKVTNGDNAYGLIGYCRVQTNDGSRALRIEYCYDASKGETLAALGRVEQPYSSARTVSASENCYLTGATAWTVTDLTATTFNAAETAVECADADAILGVLGDCGYVADVNNSNGGYPILAFQFENAIAGAKVAGYTANLGGSIGLNFHMSISDEILADESAYVIFTAANRYTKIPVAEGTDSTHGAYKIYTCEVSVKEMTAPITVQVVTSQGNSPVYTYTVAKYAAKVVNGNFTEKEKTLASAMLDFGTQAQLRFGYNTDNLAGTDKDIPSVPDAANIADYVKTIGGAAISGITSSGTTAVLDSEIALRFYFTFDEDVDISAYTFKYAGKELELRESANGYGYYVEISNIAAKNYDKTYKISVTSDEGTMTVSTSVYAYINSILTDGPSESHEVVKAAYWYCEAAKAYFAK